MSKLNDFFVPHHSMRTCRTLIMVGTGTETMGGIATVVRGYIEGGLFEGIHATYVVTHCDGNWVTKTIVALHGLLALIKALWRYERPLVHIHMSSRASFWRKLLVIFIVRSARRPYIVHMHGSEFVIFHDEECGALGKRLIAWALSRAALCLALSAEWKDNLRRIAPKARIRVLPNAVSYPPLGALADMNARRKTVVFLGRLGHRKGTYDLLAAFAQIAPRFEDVVLVCGGDGDAAPLQRLAADLGIAERVDFQGWLNPNECRELLRRATVFVLPSYAEGLPMALLEAMSWQLPVITTPVGGIPHAITHNENGILVDPGDIDALAAALESVLSDDDARSRLGKAARLTIERSYSLEATLRKLRAIYMEFGIQPFQHAPTPHAAKKR